MKSFVLFDKDSEVIHNFTSRRTTKFAVITYLKKACGAWWEGGENSYVGREFISELEQTKTTEELKDALANWDILFQEFELKS